MWFDSVCGLLVGLLVCVLYPLIAEWGGLPKQFVIAMGIANLAYGSYSFSLAVRRNRPLALIRILAAANMLWCLFCMSAAIYFSSSASSLGLAQLLSEGLFVGGLGLFEWRVQRQLV